MFNNILVIGWMFLAGWVPMDDAGFTIQENNREPKIYTSEFSGVSHIEMAFNALLFDHINLRGSIDSWQYPRKINSWTPYKEKFSIGADFSMLEFDEKKFNIILSIDRSCSHPLRVWNNKTGSVDTSYCEVSLKFKGTTKIF